MDSSPIESRAEAIGLDKVVLLMKNTRIPKEKTFSEGRQMALTMLQKVITDNHTANYVLSNLKKSPTDGE